MSQSQKEKIWNAHLNGDSRGASIEAEQALNEIDTADFSDQSLAREHAEYARLTEVTATAAAKRSDDWSEAKNDLLRSLRTVINNYPIATSESEAKKRGNYFEGTIGENESAQFICLRDLLHLANMLSKVWPRQEVKSFAVGIHNLLNKLVDEKKGQRFAYIFLIEEAPYSRAKTAYQEFLKKFGPRTESFSANQVITTTSRFLGRSLSEKDFGQMTDSLGVMMNLLVSEPTLRAFLIKELVKNLLPLVRDKKLKEKYYSWSLEVSRDNAMQKEIGKLLNNVFVGLGNDRVEKIIKPKD